MVEMNNLAAKTLGREEDLAIHKAWLTRREYTFTKRFSAQKGTKAAGLFCLPPSDEKQGEVVAKRSDGPQKAIQNAGRAF